MNAEKLLDSFGAGHGEIPLRGLLEATERRYGSLALLRSFLKRKVSGIMIKPSNLLRYHLFAP